MSPRPDSDFVHMAAMSSPQIVGLYQWGPAVEAIHKRPELYEEAITRKGLVDPKWACQKAKTVAVLTASIEYGLYTRSTGAPEIPDEVLTDLQKQLQDLERDHPHLKLPLSPARSQTPLDPTINPARPA